MLYISIESRLMSVSSLPLNIADLALNNNHLLTQTHLQ